MTDNRKKWERVRDEIAEHTCYVGPLQHDGFIRGFDAATAYWLERAESLVIAIQQARRVMELSINIPVDWNGVQEYQSILSAIEKWRSETETK